MITLKAGDKAPQFEAVDQNGNLISINILKGKRVILYFYPKDNTPGCINEACNLRDNQNLLLEKGFVIIGVSPDSVQSHKKFIDKFNLSFPLIPDVDKEVIRAYGVWGTKKFMGRTYDGVHRTTFIISANGIVEKIITKVKTKEHAQQILEEMVT